MRLVRIGRFVFNPALAPHRTGLEETIVLTGDAAEAFKRWLKRQDIADWADQHKQPGPTVGNCRRSRLR
jgi:hypothetical protein